MKTICSPGYRHSGFVATHAFGHMTHGYKLLVPMSQQLLNKGSKRREVSDKRHTQKVQISQNQDKRNIYVIIFVCHRSLMRFILRSLLCLLSTLLFIDTRNV